MVESVSTVDGSNVSGVIEEVGADGALCSDGHLRHSDRDVRIGTKNMLLFLATVLPWPNPAHVHRLASCFAKNVAWT